jgi:hypothetical protein
VSWESLQQSTGQEQANKTTHGSAGGGVIAQYSYPADGGDVVNASEVDKGLAVGDVEVAADSGEPVEPRQ